MDWKDVCSVGPQLAVVDTTVLEFKAHLKCNGATLMSAKSHKYDKSVQICAVLSLEKL
jgi:hypothetical protein